MVTQDTGEWHTAKSSSESDFGLATAGLFMTGRYYC